MALTFAAELSRLLRVHRMTRREAAERIGVRPETVRRLAVGQSAPQLKTADSLATLLNSERLTELALDLRRGVCPLCERTFVTMSRTRGRQRFCSKKCQTADHSRRERERRHHPYRVASHRLREHQDAVAAFCARCEEGGVCRDNSCELRPISPLPFIALSAVSRRVA